MSLKDDLIAAKALIDTPEKWGKGFASFKASYTPYPDEPICAMGACNSFAHLKATEAGRFIRDTESYAEMGRALDENAPLNSTADFNDADTTTHADIMALFDRAINAASIASLDAAIAECAKPLPRHA